MVQSTVQMTDPTVQTMDPMTSKVVPRPVRRARPVQRVVASDAVDAGGHVASAAINRDSKVAVDKVAVTNEAVRKRAHPIGAIHALSTHRKPPQQRRAISLATWPSTMAGGIRAAPTKRLVWIRVAINAVATSKVKAAINAPADN